MVAARAQVKPKTGKRKQRARTHALAQVNTRARALQSCQRRETEEELLRFRAAMDTSLDAIYLVDRATMGYVDVNDAACQQTGYTREELLNMGPQDFVLKSRSEIEQLYDQVIDAGPAGLKTETLARAKTEERAYLEIQHRALHLDETTLIVSVARDITARKLAEQANERLRHMYAALGALNEAILHTHRAEELFQRVCDAALESGQFFATTVLLVDPGSTWVRIVASSGFAPEEVADIRISIDPSIPEGRGLFATACRTLEPCISNDYRKDPRTSPWHANSRNVGFRAVAAVPVIRDGRAFGGMVFYARERNAFDRDVVQLLRRMAENVAFALDNFERETERRAAEQAVRTSEEKYRTILESIEDAYYEVDLNGNFVFFNSALCRLFGYSESELHGMNNRHYQSREVAASVYRTFNQVYRTGMPAIAKDWEMQRKDGTRVLVEGSVQLIKDDHDRPIGFRGIVRNVTERRHMEMALRESESRLRDLIELSSDWYWKLDTEFRFVHLEGRAVRMDPARFDPLYGKRPWEVGLDNEDPGGWEANRATMEAHKPYDIVVSRKLPDGTRHYFAVIGEPVFDATGAFAGFRGVTRDITERKQAEEATVRLGRMYAALSATNDIVFRAKSTDELYQRVCQAAVENGKFFATAVLLQDPDSTWARVAANTGLSAETVQAMRLSSDAAIPEGRGLYGLAYRTLRSSVSNDYFGDEYTRPWHKVAHAAGVAAVAAIPLVCAGRALGALLFYSHEKNAFDDEIVKLLERMAENVAFALDNFERDSERRAAEYAVRENEARFRSLTDLSSDWFWEQDAESRFTKFEGKIVSSSRSAFGRAVIGKRPWELPGAVAESTDWKRLRELYRRHEPFRDFEYAYSDRKGRRFYVAVNGKPVFDKAGKFIGYHGTTRDITVRKREEALLALEHAITRRLAEADGPSTALDDVIQLICATEGWESGEYWFVDERAEVLRFGGGWHAPDPAIKQFYERSLSITFKRGVGLAGRVWESGAPLWVSDVAKDPRVLRKDIAAESGLHSAILFPVTLEGKLIGVLDFTSRVVRPEEPRFFQAMRVIGSQIGQFLHRKQAEQVLRQSEARFHALTDLSSDWYWEQDAEFRFVKFEGTRVAGGRVDLGSAIIGKRPWEMPGVVLESADWQRLRIMHLRHEPIREFEYAYCDRKGNRFDIAVNGEPMFDASGGFAGYRGTSRDITRRKREERLLALEHAVAQSVAGVDSVRKTLRAVLSAICESEQWQTSGYWSVDAQTAEFRLEVGWNSAQATSSAIDFYRRSRGIVLPADGLLGRAWKTGEPVWVADITKEPHIVWSERLRPTAERSTFCFPAFADGKVIGVLAFGSFAMREPDERLLQTARVIGTQVGQFLQRRQAVEVLRQSEERFRALTNLSSDWYWEQDGEMRFTRVESRRDDVGAAGEYLLGKRPWETGYEIDSAEGWTRHRRDLDARQAYRDVVMYRRMPDGSTRYISVSGEPVVDNAGQFHGYRGVTREITAQKLAEQRIQYLATHDGLTDLPNRFMFNQLLSLAIEAAKRYNRTFAVLFIDLDRFKIINDTLGHAAGDLLLKEMSLRLKECLRSSDVVARLGGDEFVVLLQAADEPQHVVAVARKLLSSIIKPLSIAGQECRVTGSIGICMYPGDGDDEETLMKNADIAMYLAKEEGKNNFQFYSGHMRAKSLERLVLETNLRQALERNEFSLHYQAKADLATETIVGVEALLRWQDPKLGPVSPAQFIPIAEETGLIVPIGRWVLRTACAQNVAWQRQGLAPVCMAVNLSARQFADESLLDDIKAALAESGLAPNMLELEITEGMVMQNAERATRILNAIKALGVRLAIDDFGTGYSSLAQIKRYPIDTLKVDRSFIREIPEVAEDKAITEAIIAMGKTLKLTVVAEGVETMAQAQFLREHACDQMQGYYFSKPILPDDFAALLRRRNPAKET